MATKDDILKARPQPQQATANYTLSSTDTTSAVC